MPDPADHPKPKVQAVEEAIQLALAFRWKEALQLNQELLERFGPDEDSYNRLGKALMELGRLEEAIAAYQSTIEVNPLNQIAARQLTKLSDLSATKGKVAPVSASLASAFFIEEPGKTVLTRVVPDGELGKVQFAPGDPVAAADGGLRQPLRRRGHPRRRDLGADHRPRDLPGSRTGGHGLVPHP